MMCLNFNKNILIIPFFWGGEERDSKNFDFEVVETNSNFNDLFSIILKKKKKEKNQNISIHVNLFSLNFNVH